MMCIEMFNSVGAYRKNNSLFVLIELLLKYDNVPKGERRKYSEDTEHIIKTKWYTLNNPTHN